MAHLTPRIYQTLVNNPQDRGTAIRSVVEGMGGRMESFYFAFGDYGAVAIFELPDKDSLAVVAQRTEL